MRAGRMHPRRVHSFIVEVAQPMSLSTALAGTMRASGVSVTGTLHVTLHALPRCYGADAAAKERMTGGRDYRCPSGMNGWTADRQLALQVDPLMRKLARADRDALDRPNRTDLGTVEGVAAMHGFGVHRSQVCVDGQARMRMQTETLKLRMALVATRPPANDHLGQQSLTPQGNQPLRVQVFWMQ